MYLALELADLLLKLLSDTGARIHQVARREHADVGHGDARIGQGARRRLGRGTVRFHRVAHQDLWLRAVGTLPDDPILHAAIVAYASDFMLLSTAALPHSSGWGHENFMSASLDHVMWFHRPCRADEWLLYHCHSPAAAAARGRSAANGTRADAAGRRHWNPPAARATRMVRSTAKPTNTLTLKNARSTSPAQRCSR